MKINNIVIKLNKFATILGIEVDDKLNFEKHVSTISKKANSQLNALCKIVNVLGQKEKEILINIFVCFNSNYCPLIWHFSALKCLRRVKKDQERCLRSLLNKHINNYLQLLEISKTPTMTVKKLSVLGIETLKTIYLLRLFQTSNIHTTKTYMKICSSVTFGSYIEMCAPSSTRYLVRKIADDSLKIIVAYLELSRTTMTKPFYENSS